MYAEERQREIAQMIEAQGNISIAELVEKYGVSSESIRRDLRALELPGLWNGAMSDWNTVFVDVPASTFNPVKTVNDLLRPAHQ